MPDCSDVILGNLALFHFSSPSFRRNYKALVETTVELANKVGSSEIISRVVEDLKDESEPYRRMVMETIDKVVSALGSSDIDARLEELLIDGILFAFQEQVREGVKGRENVGRIILGRPGHSKHSVHMQENPAFITSPLLQVTDDANVMLNGFGTVVNSLGKRAKPYLSQICGTIKWRLNNKAAKIRQQAADLIARIAPVMKSCEEEQAIWVSNPQIWECGTALF